MIKIIILPEKLYFEKLEISDSEINRFSIGDDKKLNKKSGKSKSQKLSRSQKLVKSGKNLSKNKNSPNFYAKKNKLIFLINKTKSVFNCLRLRFIKTPIL